MWVIVVVAIMALLAGMSIGVVITYERPAGDLRIDRSDPSGGPYMFLELDTDVYTVIRKKQVTFRVKLEDYVTRK